MKAISLWQPWASLVVTGAKRFETRCWSTDYRGTLLIHATRRFPPEAAELCGEWPFFDRLWPHFPDAWASPDRRVAVELLPCGVILGTVELVRVVSTAAAVAEWSVYEDGAAERYAEEIRFGDYSPGRFAWELRNPWPLPRPVPCRGVQKLWVPSADVMLAVEEQLS